MQSPKQAPAIDQPPDDEQPSRRWQFSLAALMIAMSFVCVILVLSPVFRFLIDRRTLALLAVIVVAGLGDGKVTRSAAVGGIVGICLGLYGSEQRWWGWHEPADDFRTTVTTGACAAWFAGAVQLTKQGKKAGAIALLTLLIWLPYWLHGQMR